MVELWNLWLPIVASAVAVFVVSSVIHMVIPIHKNDYGRLPDEEGVLADLRARRVGPGVYMFPRAESMKDLATPEMQARYEQGPVGFLTVLPSGPPAMGKSLVQWFLLTLGIGAVVAYVTGLGLGETATATRVFRTASSAALLGYAVSYASDSIWKGVPWSVTFKFFFDGLLYALTTGAVFAWLWPDLG